jgi:benzylsuccinate CoA-transferase BbsF subunit
MEKWGLTYDEIRKIKPEIIMMSTCMQGQTGPASRHPGYGYPLASLTGFTHITGWPDRPPAGAFGPFTDFIAPLFNVVALVAALDYKERTGRGQYLDLSQYECGMHFLGPMILDYTVNNREFSRRGNRSDCASPHGVYRCQGDDRWVAIAVFTDEEWVSFCEVIGNPAWCREARFVSLAERIKNAEELDRLVEQWTITYSAEKVMEVMQAAGVAAGVALTSRDLFEDPQLTHYEALVTVPHPEMGTCTCQTTSLKLTKTPREEIKRPDLLGEHTEYVCKELLGMSEEEYVSLLLDDVFE